MAPEVGPNLAQKLVLFRVGHQPAFGATAEDPVTVTSNPIVGSIPHGVGQNLCNSRDMPDAAKSFRDVQSGFRFDQDALGGEPVVFNEADRICICIESVAGEDLLGELALLGRETKQVLGVVSQKELNNAVA